MPIGCHGLVFTGTFDAHGLSEAVRRTRDAGFDLLEIPLLDPHGFDVEGARKALAGSDLQLTASMGLPEGADISTGDADEVARGQAVLERALEILADLGSEHLCGVLYGRLKKYPGHASRTTCQPGRHRPHRPAGRSPRYHRLARGGQPVRTEPLQHGRRGTGVHRADRRELPQGAPRQLPHEHRGVGHVPARPRSRARRTPRVRPHR